MPRPLPFHQAPLCHCGVWSRSAWRVSAGSGLAARALEFWRDLRNC